MKAPPRPARPWLPLVRFEEGRERASKRLDEMWELWVNPDAFKAYVRDSIRDQLAGGKR